MNFSRFRYGDIQSWWEVPGIAYFCSLFRTAFNLLDFDIEELEEALLTDGTEECASSLLTELIVRLLNGCLGNNDISAFNYQMYLRRLFRQKCQETGRYNPFNTDIDFQFLPLRTKVEILYALCDFRLDAEDVFDLFKNLEAESLRVEPLGWDDNYSAYWYFYGTRLYREDIIRKSKGKNKKKKIKESKKRSSFFSDNWFDEEDSERVWQVVCFTEEDWTHLTEKFSKATSKVEKELYRSLSQNFLPEIPRLFQEKERLQRKRINMAQSSDAQEEKKIKMAQVNGVSSVHGTTLRDEDSAENLHSEVGLANTLKPVTKNYIIEIYGENLDNDRPCCSEQQVENSPIFESKSFKGKMTPSPHHSKQFLGNNIITQKSHNLRSLEFILKSDPKKLTENLDNEGLCCSQQQVESSPIFELKSLKGNMKPLAHHSKQYLGNNIRAQKSFDLGSLSLNSDIKKHWENLDSERPSCSKQQEEPSSIYESKFFKIKKSPAHCSKLSLRKKKRARKSLDLRLILLQKRYIAQLVKRQATANTQSSLDSTGCPNQN